MHINILIIIIIFITTKNNNNVLIKIHNTHQAHTPIKTLIYCKFNIDVPTTLFNFCPSHLLK